MASTRIQGGGSASAFYDHSWRASPNDFPSREEGLAMLKSFFTNTGYLFPYIHETFFMRKYTAMLTKPQEPPSRSWRGLLCIIFAMSISASVDDQMNAPQRRERSDFYAQKGLAFCGAQIIRGANLDIGMSNVPQSYCSSISELATVEPDFGLVHFLLLWGQYLQGTQNPLEAWTVQGLTVKTVYQLGLHNQAHSKRLTEVEQEIRKRTWLACICLDRYFWNFHW